MKVSQELREVAAVVAHEQVLVIAHRDECVKRDPVPLCGFAEAVLKIWSTIGPGRSSICLCVQRRVIK